MSAEVLSAPRPMLRAAVGLLDALDARDSVLIDGITWDEYVWFDLRRSERRPNVMLAYADGKLGFRGNGFRHENRCSHVNSLVLEVALACSAQHIAAGRTTFRRDDRRVCVEADASYYIDHWETVRHLDDIDLCIHPPPDLAVEVEEPRSPLDKLPIHAAIGVPEVWVIDRNGTAFHWLRPDGHYEPRQASRSFPMLTTADVSRFILADWPDTTAFIRAVREWAATLATQQTVSPTRERGASHLLGE